MKMESLTLLLACLATAAASASTTKYAVRGCYSSVSTGFLPMSPNKIPEPTSHEDCASYCILYEHGVAAIAGGDWCRCGTLFPNDVWQIDDSNCNVTCPLDATEMCGARHAWTVVDTGLGAGVNAEVEEIYGYQASTYVASALPSTSSGFSSHAATAASVTSSSASATISLAPPVSSSQTTMGGAARTLQAPLLSIIPGAWLLLYAVCSFLI